MKVYNKPSKSEWSSLVQRPSSSTGEEVLQVVQEVLREIQENGEQALLKYNAAFNNFHATNLLVSLEEFESAAQQIPSELKEAMELAYSNIFRFHQAQIDAPLELETQSGVRCWQKSVAIDRVGLYIPGGTAPLFSTVLMLAIPAQIAGCSQVVLCSPPDAQGNIHPAILYACKRCGITQVYKTGGAQAIAAMAYGTDSIPAVDKIFGPGNQYVTLAKQLVAMQGVAIDMPAGPSEVEVLADDSAVPAFIAADLLAQAEHGITSQVLLISTSEQITHEVNQELDRQLQELPRRDIAARALENSRAIVVNTMGEAMELTNLYGPEHLIISCRNYRELAAKVRNAGSVFLGNYTPESVGDYASGTNHTLPTNGHTKAYSGVNMDSFMKKITFQELSPQGLQSIGTAVQIMAAHEHLDGHKNAVTLRLQAIEEEGSILTEDHPASWTQQLTRKVIEEMAPYSSARTEYTGDASTFLDANENPYNTSFNRYPDPLQCKLKARIARLKGVNSNQIFLGNGSDEAIDLLYRCFCDPRIHNAVSIAPSYGMYQVAAETNDVELRKALLTSDFQLDLDAIAGQIDHHTRLLFLCSPNNPSGNSLNPDDLISLCESFGGLVVIDEAYIDFAAQASFLTRLTDFPNLVILQTFSKAWGMAGIRLGMAFAHPSVIAVFNKVKYPYNINVLTQEKALELLEQESNTKEMVATIIQERNSMQLALKQLAYVKVVFPSDANFLLVKVSDANAIYKYLVKRSIIIRNRHSVVLCENCLRITIGSPEENKELMEVMKQFNYES